MAGIDTSKYAHSPVHRAVAARDYSSLRKLLASLPRLSDPSEITTESQSTAEEAKAETISAAIDRRDVPGRETPLHLAVRLSDASAAEMLMAAGADWSLQNEQGWSALQEAICLREEGLARIIVRHYQPLAWGKWRRRLPRLVAAMRRMRDFYMELTFHFESSVIPFISRIAPSDTYKIFKKGSNLRADMTMAGFDGFRIQRSEQSIVFLGDGDGSGRAPPGSLLMISHRDKEVMDALEGAGAPASEAEVAREVAAMSQTSIFRPGIDVTQAVLLPQLTWRRQERTEMVGAWRAKVYDMHHVVVSVKSRRVPGAMTDDEFFSSTCGGGDDDDDEDEYDDILTDEERRQLESALKMESSDEVAGRRSSCCDQRELGGDSESSSRQEKKGGWFGQWGGGGGGNKGQHSHKAPEGLKKMAPPRSSLCVEEKVSDLLGDSPVYHKGRHSMEMSVKAGEDLRKGRDLESKKFASAGGARREGGGGGGAGKESEYRKGLRPILWLVPNFPLRTEELLPLLDILANKVKAIRRLRELMTTKLPSGTFPVKVAIPVVPTIRVLVTFTKFEELQPAEEFSTPPSSPGGSSRTLTPQPSSSWIQWMKAPYRQAQSSAPGPGGRVEDLQDPFLIPTDYAWTTLEAKKKKMQESKAKSKKARTPQQ